MQPTQNTPEPRATHPTRRLDGKPETPADIRFFALRESGYTGWIDQDGYAVPDSNPACPDCNGPTVYRMGKAVLCWSCTHREPNFVAPAAQVCTSCALRHGPDQPCLYDTCRDCGVWYDELLPSPTCNPCVTPPPVFDKQAAAPVVQTLQDAQLYLRRHGWMQGGYYDGTCRRFTPAACLVGAVGIVCYGGPVDAPALMFDDPGFGSFEAAVGFLDVYLGRRFGLNVYDYNDVKGRSAAEVLAMLDDAAAAARSGMFPMCCDRFMAAGASQGYPDDLQVGCLGEAEPFVSVVHVCSVCGVEDEVEITDPDIRERLVAEYRTRAAAVFHDGHAPGTSDDCDACDVWCYCTADFACVNHGGPSVALLIDTLPQYSDTEQITVDGELAYLDERMSHQGRPWLTATLHTSDGLVPLQVWPVAYERLCGVLTLGRHVTVSGTVDKRSESAHLRVADVVPGQGATA